MSLFSRFKRWLTSWVLTFAFTFPKADYPRQFIHYLQLFLFNSKSSWISKEPPYGYWVADDLKKNAKREALQDRISEADVIILWIPGGGFRFNLSKLYTPTFAEWIRALEADKGIKSMIFAADYRLGPENLFPAPVEDVEKTFNWLVNTMNIDPEKIIIGGDDVGAAIALDTLFLKVPSHQKPAALIFSSPYTGLEAGGESWRANLGEDMINENSITRMENAYMKPEKYDSDNESDDENEQQELKPFGYLQGDVELGKFLPSRLLLYLGGKEVLLDEGGLLASRARSSGVQVIVVQEPTGIHLWSMLPDIFTSGWQVKQNAIDRFVQFVAELVKK